jgi:ABC-type uncharacterized transport system permease subunit
MGAVVGAAVAALPRSPWVGAALGLLVGALAGALAGAFFVGIVAGGS